VTVTAPKEIPDCSSADVVAFGVAFRLNVDALEPEGVLIDYAANAIVAAAPERATCIRRGAAVSHAEEEGDHQTLEEGGRCRANPIKQILPERCLDLRVCRTHDFVRCLRAAHESRWPRLSAVHIPRLPANRVAGMESQVIPMTQDVCGWTLRATFLPR